MTAKRQSSTTSLSKYARTSSPGLQNRSNDFCNAFWGLGDGGVDVLFARMRGATRTIDELRNFWKERSAIEEEYAKRLSKLAKVALGRDEIGELHNCLDTVRLETDKQASFHLQLAQTIRSDLETHTATFFARQTQFKKTYQASIEKEFKAKQIQESYVNKSREKYEADCVRINSYTAQSTLVQGKDLEKIHLKLERAQQTVQANERDFANFAKAYQDTCQKWEQDWKVFCDMCQDQEDARLEFMKDHLWAYANAVSTVCVSDDEACEHMRLALEQMESEKDMENFVRDYGTGNLIPDPPAFVNYTKPDAIPSSSSRPSTHPARFIRSSQNLPPLRQTSTLVDEEPTTNSAGIGAGGGGSRKIEPQQSDPSLSRQQSTRSRSGSQAAPPQTNGASVNGYGAGVGQGGQGIARRPTQSSTHQSSRIPQDPNAEPIDPTAQTYIKVGSNAYPVDLSKDPQQQQQQGSSSRMGGSSSIQPSGSIDPLAKHMEDLKNAVSTSGSVRRKPTQTGQPSRQDSFAGPSSLSPPSSNAAITSGGSRMSVDYGSSAAMVVGEHPSASRPSSPNPPTAVFMALKNTVSPSGSDVIDNVLSDYHAALPGERKSVSRSNSRRASYAGPAHSPVNGTHNYSQSQGQNLARPPSQVGHPGIGAHGSRSNSPQPISRGPSPAPNARNSLISPPSASSSMSQRAPSPNNMGIALDPSGRVIHDDMASRYQQPPRQAPPPQQYNNNANPQRRTSYVAGGNGMVPPPPPQVSSYGITPPPPPSQYPASQPSWVQPSYSQPQYQPPPPPQQPVYQPQPHQGAYSGVNGLNRGLSVGAGGGGGYLTNGVNSVPQQQPQQQQPQQALMHPQQSAGYQQGGYRAPSPARRSPTPQPPPTGQTTEEGVGILFYVKALYDYNATIEEEFDFQAGDIIAVTATPEDGWWSGELLDEDRRQKGRHVFPSNFVCLF